MVCKKPFIYMKSATWAIFRFSVTCIRLWLGLPSAGDTCVEESFHYCCSPILSTFAALLLNIMEVIWDSTIGKQVSILVCWLGFRRATSEGKWPDVRKTEEEMLWQSISTRELSSRLAWLLGRRNIYAASWFETLFFCSAGNPFQRLLFMYGKFWETL